jgi:protein O-GlcNAc transferase
MINIAEALAIGTQHHQAGRLAEAERVYRQILAVEPQQPDTLHQLGMLAMQARQFSAAVDLIGKAIRADASQPAFYANLGEAHRHLGALSEAVACYRAALRIQPDLAQAQALLGAALAAQHNHAEAEVALVEALRLRPDDTRSRARLGQVLHDQSMLSEAEGCFRDVLKSEPQSVEAHMRLADVLQSQARYDEARGHYRQALAVDPRNAHAHNNLGLIDNAHGQRAQAAEHFQAALAIEPRHAAALTNLGLVRDAEDCLAEAEQCYRAAAEADPRSLPPRFNLGSLLQRRGLYDAAMQCYEAVLSIDPNYAAAYAAMSQVHQAREEFGAAITYCQRAVALEPNNARTLSNLGAALSDQGRRDEAIACFDRALALDGNLAMAHSNRGVALQAIGRLDEAIDEHRAAVALDPANSGFHSNLLYALNYSPRCDATAIFEEHLAWAKRHAEPLTAAARPHDNDRSPGRRLRVGYVSPHFLAHAVNFFVEPLLAHHDRGQFEVFCYSDVGRGDETTNRLRRHVEHWRDTALLTAEQVHDLVRQDRIDIMVDLTGHIAGGKRMSVFARKPAPVQVSYIGYQNTTGMSAMDYRLTDAYSDPPGATDRLYTEKLVRLPRSFFCYLPSPDAPPIVPPPAVTNGAATFGSFNNFSKVTTEVLDAWASILAGAPRSRLVILGDMVESLRQRIADAFASRQIASDRLELANRLPRERYLELIQHVDIALDPFPFNGHTTTCDCLWQGVPVITLSGETYVSRFGASALATLGLNELIVSTPEKYVERAVKMATDIGQLTLLRQELRSRMAASALLDFAGFTRNLEAEYRRMWEAWLGA